MTALRGGFPILWAGLILAVVVGPASGFRGGPPDGYAGNPPDNLTCHDCHFTFPLDSGDGSMQVLGLPAEYTPGETYSLVLELLDPGQERWGFELTVLDDAAFLLQGGQLVQTDIVNTQLSVDSIGEIDYLKHTFAGTLDGTLDGVTWGFDWTAPPADVGSVTFYAAGNAANGDATFLDDYIYALELQLFPATATPTEQTTWGRLKEIFTEE